MSVITNTVNDDTQGIGMLNWLLPEGAEGPSTSYLFSEPTLLDLKSHLFRAIDKTYSPPVSIAQFVKVSNPLAFAPQISVMIDIAKSRFQRLTGLEKDYGYKMAQHEIDLTSVKSAQGVVFATLFLCIHKPSCAYGKIIKAQLFFIEASQALQFVYLEVLGSIPEDRIGWIPDPYDHDTIYSPP